MTYDVEALRRHFPALARSEDGRPVAYLDGPAGTQVPESVIEAMAGHLRHGTSNHGGAFGASREVDDLEEAARAAASDLLGGDSDEVVFGPNMTTLTFAMSRSLAREWGPGDEVIVTRLDHDANVTPWRMAAEDAGATVRVTDFDPTDGRLDVDHLVSLLGPQTRLVAFTHASNALGTIPPVQEIVDLAHSFGALTYVDAVHFAPHGSIDVRKLDTDFLVCSPYKFYGPHAGVLYGKREHLGRLTPYKVVPAPDVGPGRWETGTASFETLAGVVAAIDHLAALGEGEDRRSRLVEAYRRIGGHERSLAERFLAGTSALDHVRVYGITDPAALGERAPTFAVGVAGLSSHEVATRLGDQGIYVWDGNYYAVGVMEHLGLAEEGLTRIGFVQYSTEAEVDRVLDALASLA
jgi:cysteine desulfurase family protein (TIGR01976 family)